MGTICWKCGSEVPAGAQACQKCGTAVANSGGVVAQPFAPAPPMSSGPVYSSPPPPPPAQPYQPMASAPSAGYAPVAPVPPAPPAPAAMQTVAQPGFAPVQSGFSPPPPPPAMAVAGVAATPPARSGGSTAVKVILIVVAIFIGLGLLAAGVVGYGIWRVAHAVKVASRDGNFTVHGTDGGTFSVNSSKTFTAAELGTDIYPGATTGQGGMRLTLPTGSMITGVFLTSDSKDQVVSFYRSKFGSDVAVMDTNDTAVITDKVSDKESIMVSVTSRPNENDGKTKIAIVHTTGK